MAIPQALPQPPVAMAKVYKYEPGTVVATRPVHELWAHVRHCELPSWQTACKNYFRVIFCPRPLASLRQCSSATS